MSANTTSRDDRPSLSVVVPIRDEERTLRDLHRSLREVLPADTEIILVDDGSRDRSPQVLSEIAGEDPGVVAFTLLRPFGKSHALAEGFRRCRGELIATIDADLQESPGDIVRLMGSLRQGHEVAPGSRGEETPALDLVTGWRKHRRDSRVKVLCSRLFNSLVRMLSGVSLRDVNCGLKVMRREVVEAIPLEGGYHRFIPLLAHWRGFQVGEVEIDHAPRLHGRSRFGSERILHGLIDLVVLVFLERFERRPSRLFLSCGTLLFTAGLAILLYIVSMKLTPPDHSIESRYPLLILGVLLLVVGIQVVSTGFLAELVAQRRRGESGGEIRTFEIERARATPRTSDQGLEEGQQRSARVYPEVSSSGSTRPGRKR